MTGKALVLSILPFTIGLLWASLVLVLTILAATVFSGGHPPFAIFPLVTNIAGVVVIYPLCLILSGIGQNAFQEQETVTIVLTSRRIAIPITLFAIADGTLNLTYQMAIPFTLFLSLAHPLPFFRPLPLPGGIPLWLPWSIGSIILGGLTFLNFSYAPLLVLAAALSLVCSLWGGLCAPRSVRAHPARLSRITFRVLLAMELAGAPFALLLR